MIDSPEIRIDEAYDAQPAFRTKTRGYLGASAIGDPCDAKLAYTMRGFPDDPLPAHVKRILKLGQTIEDMVIADLRMAGYTIHDRDGLTGEQFRYSIQGGHAGFLIDGLIEIGDELRILEIKSMNDAQWNKFQKHGLRASHPQYYAQLQMELGVAEISSGLIIAYNKNNSKYHSEIVPAVPFEYSAQQARIETVMANRAAKIAKDESDWRCRSCWKRSVCWSGRLPDKTCKTCAHAIADTAGGWFCALHRKTCDEPCGDWQVYRPLDRAA